MFRTTSRMIHRALITNGTRHSSLAKKNFTTPFKGPQSSLTTSPQLFCLASSKTPFVYTKFEQFVAIPQRNQSVISLDSFKNENNNTMRTTISLELLIDAEEDDDGT